MKILMMSLAAAGLALAAPLSASAASTDYPMSDQGFGTGVATPSAVTEGMVRIIPVEGPYGALKQHDDGTEQDQLLATQAMAAADPAINSALQEQGLTSSAVVDIGMGPNGTTLVYVAT
jgi:hypothetical protein